MLHLKEQAETAAPKIFRPRTDDKNKIRIVLEENRSMNRAFDHSKTSD